MQVDESEAQFEVDDTSWENDDDDESALELAEFGRGHDLEDLPEKSGKSSRKVKFFLRSEITLDRNEPYSGDDGDGILTVLSDGDESKVQCIQKSSL